MTNITRLIALCMACLAASAHAATAVRLYMGECDPPPNHVCNASIPIYRPGIDAQFWVAAVDSNGERATNYTGTVEFTSTDPTVHIPAHTFTLDEDSVFLASAVFSTPGATRGFLLGTNLQIVTAIDRTNQIRGQLGFSLIGNPVPRIPATSTFGIVALAFAVALSGVLVLSLRRRGDCHA